MTEEMKNIPEIDGKLHKKILKIPNTASLASGIAINVRKIRYRYSK